MGAGSGLGSERTHLPVLGRDEPRTIIDRLAGRSERIHVLTGAVCNNNCVFCMEEDRDGRYVVNSATTDETIRFLLEQHRDVEEMCFTSGEPTTNKRLPAWVKMAKDAGVRRISVMTNGRALSHEPYTRLLIAAGMRRFYVSIHGHTQKLHEGLVRTPGAFDQTVEGMKVVKKYAAHGVDLHTSTVITKRNLPEIGAIYRFLRGLGVDQVVLNVMQANGRADTNFEHIFPKYTEIASTFRAFLDEERATDPRPKVVLVDIPLCTTEAIPDEHRGYVEAYAHYEPPKNESHALELAAESDPSRRVQSPTGELVKITRGDLDDAARSKRAECASCKHDASCEGVWKNYLSRFGWDELQPVPR
jgi:MoaA/NifB/PqqE/SkfB family radical SAM enzyme